MTVAQALKEQNQGSPEKKACNSSFAVFNKRIVLSFYSVLLQYRMGIVKEKVEPFSGSD